MGKLRPTRQIRPAGLGTYTNLNSHRELRGKPFFSLKIMDGSDFQQNKPQRCKTGIKNEVKTFHVGNHIRTWTVISKKSLHLVFQSACGPRLQSRGCDEFTASYHCQYFYCQLAVLLLPAGSSFYCQLAVAFTASWR